MEALNIRSTIATPSSTHGATAPSAVGTAARRIARPIIAATATHVTLTTPVLVSRGSETGAGHQVSVPNTLDSAATRTTAVALKHGIGTPPLATTATEKSPSPAPTGDSAADLQRATEVVKEAEAGHKAAQAKAKAATFAADAIATAAASVTDPATRPEEVIAHLCYAAEMAKHLANSASRQVMDASYSIGGAPQSLRDQATEAQAKARIAIAAADAANAALANALTTTPVATTLSHAVEAAKATEAKAKAEAADAVAALKAAKATETVAKLCHTAKTTEESAYRADAKVSRLKFTRPQTDEHRQRLKFELFYAERSATQARAEANAARAAFDQHARLYTEIT